MVIRDAVETDAGQIRDIYNDAVENTTAIWNETCVDLENRIAWMAARRQQGFPVIVRVDENGTVAGYASFGDWRAFDGYRHTVEHSVYVHKDHRGGGHGRELMLALIERARAMGKHAMVAGIDADNAGSIALHQKLGFQTVGLLPQVGCKFGRWLDLAFLQLQLDDRPTP